MRSIWNQANQLGNEDQTEKAAKNKNWVALPLRSVTVDGPPFSVPRYLHLDLGKQTQRSVARFRLHSHFPKLVLRMSSIFSRNKLMIPIVLSQSLWMFSVWLVSTSNLNSQTTWLKVKLKLVNFKGTT